MPGDLSILIVNWNSKAYLQSCLRTIRATCARLSLQVVVVDAGSFDGCQEVLGEMGPAVTFVQCDDNPGFGGANNRALQLLRAPMLLLLNPDTELQAGSVQELLGAFEKSKDIGLAGPRLLNSDGTLQTSCVQAVPTPLNQALDSEFLRRCFPRSKLWGVADAFRLPEASEVQAVSGACMMMPTELFRRLGGFSPSYFMYAEDLDLCARVRRAGYRVIHVPTSIVTHHGGGSSAAQVSDFATVQMRIALHTYMTLHFGRGAASRYRLLQAMSATVRMILTLPAMALGSKAARPERAGTIRKWTSVLKWALSRSPGAADRPQSSAGSVSAA